MKHIECPKCRHRMEPVIVGGITVDTCSFCGGHWFDGGEIKKLLRIEGSEGLIDTSSRKLSEKLNNYHKLLCPHCNIDLKILNSLDQYKLIYEGCDLCFGVFLDSGEFSAFKFQKKFQPRYKPDPDDHYLIRSQIKNSINFLSKK